MESEAVSKNFKIKNGLETTNITASANISSSGTIISNNLTIDAVTGISSILKSNDNIVGLSVIVGFVDLLNLILFKPENGVESVPLKVIL